MTFAELTPGQLRRDPLPLRGRVAVITGVSRRAGIGYAIARRLAAQGASLVLHHFAPHDREQPWGADPGGPEAVISGVTEALADPDAAVWHQEADLSDPDAPSRLIESGVATSRFLDILGYPRRPGPPDRLAGHRRGRLDHRPGHQLRGRLPPLGLTRTRQLIGCLVWPACGHPWSAC
jgi:hypothetical protein